MLIGFVLRLVIVIRLVLIPILIVIPILLLWSVFLGAFPCVQVHVLRLLLLLKLVVVLFDVGLVVVLLGDLVEMQRVQNPAFE
jgi:hypothetical protein